MKIIEEDGVKYEFTEVKKGDTVIGTIKTPYYSPEDLEKFNTPVEEPTESVENE